ncbi:Glycoside hydrolase, family 2, immunoglobulin-like beta-sandwich [Corchorus olitorius]|uniref:Glycoside hydrolase, family 2, immunoglobulin-like beta-sandwich n=1 Tax=Corchorus olitorius TaxID=93759 RepID=A0A1R3JWX3_9ROSI|nr:Glycoside hydrolase, family 2, immunoglobulin-like beta-sandwich [Corchorus olitorius]
MVEIGKIVLDSGWLAARSTEVELTGTQLTTTQPPTGPTAPWMEAVVPGTVLATLVKNKHVADPFYGLNNETILDIADSGREYYTFWFFTRFQCKLSGTQHIDLNFRAINYSGEVYLNGHKNVLPKGMFRRHSLEVTDLLNPDGENLLAVLIYPPDHPGSIPPEGGQGGDHEIGKDVATQYVEGWDWIAPVRAAEDKRFIVKVPWNFCEQNRGIGTLVSGMKSQYLLLGVYLHATTELENKSAWVAECSLNIQVTTELDGSVCLMEHLQTQHVSVPAGERIQYTFPQLFFYKPNLWWPNGMGKQSLYNVSITVVVKDYGESDSWDSLFGFRKIESHIDSATGGRLFKVNGQPIFIRGGNWILSDCLLRLSKERYKTDIKFHADMNLNMIRCWGGGLAERPEFYHYCDLYGLLVGCDLSLPLSSSVQGIMETPVWQEFWITGDVDGRGVPVSNPNGPLDHDLFMLCARDTVKLLRNHPSLALWVGGNEQVPPPDINTALKNDLKLHPYFENQSEKVTPVKELDPSQYLDGTRIYIQGSMWDGFANGKGDFTDGPYEIQNPEDFFKDDFYQYGFNPEVGSVGMPVAATIRATMPPEGWQIPLFKKLSNGYTEEVPNPIWDYHKYIPYSKPEKVHDQIELYGISKDLDDFCLKTQNPWTGLRGQFYDHLLDQTAGFYGCRCAAEPIHVQLNLATYFIEAVNTTSKELSAVAIEASVWDLEGACPYYEVFDKLSLPPKKVVSISEIKYPKSENPKPVYFVLLKLYHVSDYSIISRNFYWLHLPEGDYKLLEPYRSKRIPLKMTSKTFIRGSSYDVEMHVQNTSKKPDLKTLTYKNNFASRHDDGDFDMASLEPVDNETEENEKTGIFKRLYRRFSRETDGLKVTEVNGSDVGVAFFLNFSVHASKSDHKEGEDTRILPVHYSDNYFSLVPGEEMTIKISFKVPQGVTPRVTLEGWNYPQGVDTVL